VESSGSPVSKMSLTDFNEILVEIVKIITAVFPYIILPISSIVKGMLRNISLWMRNFVPLLKVLFIYKRLTKGI